MERLTVRQVIQTERECVARQQCDRNCAKCDLVMDAKDILSAYEHVLELLDAEEQGLLVRLPCKVGDTYYCIIRQCGSARVEETKLRYQYIETAIRGLGEWAFSTREEAEAALAAEADDAADRGDD